jgi:hypothetical protein
MDKDKGKEVKKLLARSIGNKVGDLVNKHIDKTIQDKKKSNKK